MKHIRKSRKALSQLKKAANGGTNTFALVYKDKLTKSYIGKVCYASLNYDNAVQAKGKEPVSFLSTIQPLSHTLSEHKDTVVLLLEWLFRDSPYASVFYTKSAEKALKQGMICHTDVSASLLIGGLSIAREINECPDKVRIWGELVELGMPLIYAYVATYFLEKSGERGFRVTRPPYNSNHMSLDYPLTTNYIKTFCSGQVVPNVKRNIFRKNTNYMGVFRLWGVQEGGGHDFMFSKKHTKIEHKGWNNKPYYTTDLTYKTKSERKQFVKEFTKQMKEICYG